MRPVFGEHVYPAEGRCVAVPAPEIAEAGDRSLGPGPFREGGDVLVLGRHVFVGNSRLASTTLGIAWLRKYGGYTVEEVPAAPSAAAPSRCDAPPDRGPARPLPAPLRQMS